MRNKPFFSIIVPIYNVAEVELRECIESLQKQTLTDIEIILIDDGSKNDSNKICFEYAASDSRIQLFEQENSGVSSARNNGIKHASSEFLIFVDPDDWLELTACAKLKKAVKEYDPDILVFAHYSGVPNNEKAHTFKENNSFLFEIEQKENIVKSILFQIDDFRPIEFGSVWGKVYRKELVTSKKLLFLEHLPRAQDRIFNLYSFEEATSIAYLNEPLYHYRWIGGSASNKYNPENYNYLGRVVREAKNYVEQYQKNKSYIDAVNVFAFYNMSSSIFSDVFHKNNQKTYFEKQKKFRKILRSDPFKNSLKDIHFSSIKDYKEKLKLFFFKLGLFFPLYLWFKFKN